MAVISTKITVGDIDELFHVYFSDNRHNPANICGILTTLLPATTKTAIEEYTLLGGVLKRSHPNISPSKPPIPHEYRLQAFLARKLGC